MISVLRTLKEKFLSSSADYAEFPQASKIECNNSKVIIVKPLTIVAKRSISDACGSSGYTSDATGKHKPFWWISKR